MAHKNLSPWTVPELTTCTCGKQHTQVTGMPQVWLGTDVLEQAADLLAATLGKGSLLLVADPNTAPVANKLAATLSTIPHHIYVYTHPVEALDTTVHELQTHLASDIRGLVAVGSGSITDVTRLVSFQAGIPFASVPTAASMDGYLSWGAPVLMAGFKQTFNTHSPVAVLADLNVIASAPARLTRAGFGDVLGKYTSIADWHLGHLLTQEYWCPALATSVQATLSQCSQITRQLGSNPAGAAKAVIEALFVTGHAMICAGNSRPASGAEHHMSHFWEMQTLAAGTPMHLHGEQVGVACSLSAAMYEHLLALPELVENAAVWQERQVWLSDQDTRQRRVLRAFGDTAAQVLAGTPKRDAEVFGHISYEAVNAWWRRCRTVIADQVPPAVKVRNILRQAGAVATPRELGLSAQLVHDAILYARELRPRLTILDVAAAAGQLEQLASQLAEESCSW